jgi:hypothetical protein
VSLICPTCNFQRGVEGAVRLELCPRCAADGRDVYLVEARRRAVPARHDLIGLLATARGELARARARLGRRPTADR